MKRTRPSTRHGAIHGPQVDTNLDAPSSPPSTAGVFGGPISAQTFIPLLALPLALVPSSCSLDERFQPTFVIKLIIFASVIILRLVGFVDVAEAEDPVPVVAADDLTLDEGLAFAPFG